MPSRHCSTQGSAPPACRSAASPLLPLAARAVAEADAAGHRLRVPANVTGSHTTTNVGVVGGGLARCTVAGECSFEWEMRPVQGGDAGFVKERMAAAEATLLAEMRAVHPGAALETEAVCAIDGREWLDASPALHPLTALLGGPPPARSVASGPRAALPPAARRPAAGRRPRGAARADRQSRPDGRARPNPPTAAGADAGVADAGAAAEPNPGAGPAPTTDLAASPRAGVPPPKHSGGPGRLIAPPFWNRTPPSLTTVSSQPLPHRTAAATWT